VIGWGSFSPVNLSGARVPPSAPSISGTPKIKESAIDSITITWLSAANALSYELFQTKINSERTENWAKISETTLAQYKVYGLENTQSYKFKVRSKTQCETGTFSDSLFVTRSTVSEQMKPLEAIIKECNIEINWSAPLNGGSPILKYKVELLADGRKNCF